MKKISLNVISIYALILLVTTGALKPSAYDESSRIKIGGDGGWDYISIDSETRRLYLTRTNRVMVIDVDSGKLIGEIGPLEGVHGTSLAKEFNRGFASSGKSGELVAFDLKTLQVIQRLKVGQNPDALVYDFSSKNVFVFNGKSENLSIVDAATLKLLSTVTLGGKPEFAVSDGNGKVFVAIENKNELIAIDTKTNRISSHYALGKCEEPTGLSLDDVHHLLIVGCGNKLATIVNAATSAITQSFTVGDGVDATAFDPIHHLAFISAGEGKLTILSEENGKFSLFQELRTAQGARTLAEDTKTGKIFLPIAQFTGERPNRQLIPGTFAIIIESIHRSDQPRD